MRDVRLAAAAYLGHDYLLEITWTEGWLWWRRRRRGQVRGSCTVWAWLDGCRVSDGLTERLLGFWRRLEWERRDALTPIDRPA